MQNEVVTNSTAWIPVWVGLITGTATLLGVTVGGFITYFVKKAELAHQIKEEDRKLKIARLEDLHERILSLISASAGVLTGYVDMRSRGSTVRKEIGDILATPSLAVAKVNSLLKIYANEFEADLNELLVLWEAMIDGCTDFISDPRCSPADLVAVQAQVAGKCRDLETKVRGKIQKYLLV